MKYVVQDLANDGEWDERPGRFSTIDAALREVGAHDRDAQIVEIPSGRIVWRCGNKS